jgi:hypothetical protein
MIHESLWSLVGLAPQGDEHAPDLVQIRLESGEESTCLKVFRGHADGDAFLLDDIPCKGPISTVW